jgi:ornithine cyclodeaminase/alanine dehydrogenase-like protein (mu-crystallin family)
MAVTLGLEMLGGVLPMREAIDLLEAASVHEAAGETTVSPRLNTPFAGGWMRILFAADRQSGYFATKAYHLIEGVGVRFVVSLYRLADGELLAVMDGRTITELRTGAASGVTARKVPLSGLVSVGVVGSGHQARTQLESLASVYTIGSAAVYSPTPANREAYAREMSARLGFAVTPVDSVEAAVRGRQVVAAASSNASSEPNVRGAWLEKCRLLCAVGNTRPQFAEIDSQCLSDAALVVVDSPLALEEAGEMRRALQEGLLPETKRATLAQLVTGAVPVPAAGMVVFKSVGTALQDLALAARYYELLGEGAGVPAAPGLASLRSPVRQSTRP